MTQTHKSIILDKAKTAGLQVVMDEGGTLILGDEVFALEFSEMYPSFTYPYILPPYGAVVGISFNANGEVGSAYKLVDDKPAGAVDPSLSPKERLRRTPRLLEHGSRDADMPVPTEQAKRELVFLLSGEGKTDEELVDEVWEAVVKYREAKARGEDVKPVLDIRPSED